MTLQQAHQRMAQLMIPPALEDATGSTSTAPADQQSHQSQSTKSTGRFQGPAASVAASDRTAQSVSHLLQTGQHEAPMNSCVRSLADGTRLVTALSMLVFDQSLADPRQLESLRKAGKKHMRETSSSSVGPANSEKQDSGSASAS